MTKALRRKLMDTRAILANLRAERDRLNQAIAALEALSAATDPVSSPGRKIKEAAKNKTFTMSTAGRQRIAEAQKKRWAKKKAAAKKSAVKSVAGVKGLVLKTATPKKIKRVVSLESRKKMAAAQKKRWAKKKVVAKAAPRKMAPSSPTEKAGSAEAAKA
jgi:hypothetical protein